MSSSRAIGLVVVVLLVASAAVPPVTTSQTNETCSTTVIHDAFRFDTTTVSAAANDSATDAVKNTAATVEQGPGFIRVRGTNPNGYCVQVRVQISDEIVSPAELGTVESNDGHVEAEWHAARDLDRDETYTEVIFELPANSTATFAPSTVRIESLSWTGTAKEEGGSLLDQLPNVSFGDDKALENRTYTFSPENNSEYVTVPLQDPNSDREIEEWSAMYRVDDGDWRPVTKDADAAVFYREPDSDHVQFVFNDPNAEVEFTANPTRMEKAESSWESWTSGWGILGDWFGDDEEEPT